MIFLCMRIPFSLHFLPQWRFHFLGSGGGGGGGGIKSEVEWTGVEGLCAHMHGCSSCYKLKVL